MTVSDNPLTAGEVIVTLMFTGPGHQLPNGPFVYSLVSDTVLELWPGATVTGAARGGFDLSVPVGLGRFGDLVLDM